METMSLDIVLYSYWRSSSSWRVRNVLSLKGIPYQYKAVNLLKDEQLSEEYATLNPSRTVPSLWIDGNLLSESVPIMEYLEETRKEPALLPSDPYRRAKVRQIVEMVCSDIQPLQNLRVLKRVGEEKKGEWGKFWIEDGFRALEKVLSASSSRYCVGEEITLADCVLVPQVYNANRFLVDMSLFPTISRIHNELMALDAFQRAHPDRQPDCPTK